MEIVFIGKPNKLVQTGAFITHRPKGMRGRESCTEPGVRVPSESCYGVWLKGDPCSLFPCIDLQLVLPISQTLTKSKPNQNPKDKESC